MKKNAFILLFIAATLTTCKKDHMLDCFKSAGKTETEIRAANPFTRIDLKNNVDLIIVPNSSFYIKVTAGDNLIDGIITELSGETLYIRNENRCNWMRSFKNQYTVEVGMDKPVKIDYYGSGDITCKDTIRTDEFFFDCWNGSGTIDLLFNCSKTHINNNIGRADYLVNGYSGVSFIYMNDVSPINASGMKTGYSYIRNRSTGDCHINVSTELVADIEYNGNIYYSGNPASVVKNISGSGKVVSE